MHLTDVEVRVVLKTDSENVNGGTLYNLIAI